MKEAVFLLLEGGLMTTLQDEGRRGFKKYGVPQSGPMDYYAFHGGNFLFSNERGALALEFTFPAPKFLALQDIAILLTGANFSPSIDGRSIPYGEILPIAKGSCLAFSSPGWRRWCYLFIWGGFWSRPLLGSSSTYLRGGLGGMDGRQLKEGDTLYKREGENGLSFLGRRLSSLKTSSFYHSSIRFLPGPQFHLFTRKGRETFLGSTYRVGSRWDRMGYFLEGPAIESRDTGDSISEGLTPGAIQVLGDGKPVVMTADAQTIGGYKKIGWVIKRDLPSLVQMERERLFRFVLVKRREAQALIQEEEDYQLALGRPFTMKLRVDGELYLVEVEKVEKGL